MIMTLTGAEICYYIIRFTIKKQLYHVLFGSSGGCLFNCLSYRLIVPLFLSLSLFLRVLSVSTGVDFDLPVVDVVRIYLFVLYI